MNNLFQNPFCLPAPGSPENAKAPQYFARTPNISYDNLTLHGYRTSSVTMLPGAPAAVESYILPIPVAGAHTLRWGYIMRAIEVQSVQLLTAFYDAGGNHLTTMKHPVGGKLRYQFSAVLSAFPIPAGASTARLSMELWGKTTAFTYFAPMARLMEM